MALTLADVAQAPGPQFSLGLLKCVFKDITFDNSYNTGGESLTPADVGMTVIVFVASGWALHSTPTTMVGAVYNYATNKLIATYATANAANVAFAEATSTNDLSAQTVRVAIFGQ